jgi:hypothetical protein
MTTTSCEGSRSFIEIAKVETGRAATQTSDFHFPRLQTVISLKPNPYALKDLFQA